MTELLTIYREYAGIGLYMALFLCALIYLNFSLKDGRRVLIVYSSVIFLAIAFCPLVSRAYYAFVGDDTFRRLYWLLPLSIAIALACTLLVKAESRLLIPLILLLVVCGVLTYSKLEYRVAEKAENAYQLPQEVVDVCDYMIDVSDDLGRNVWVAIPVDFVSYVRQYTSRINLFYGRDMLDDDWNNGNDLYVTMGKVVPDMNIIDHYMCDYVIITKDQIFSQDPEEHGYVLEAVIDDYYQIYRNEAHLSNMNALNGETN